jgi:hypothetical protein
MAKIHQAIGKTAATGNPCNGSPSPKVAASGAMTKGNENAKATTTRKRVPVFHRRASTSGFVDSDCEGTKANNRTIGALRSAMERAIAHLKNWKIIATGYLADSRNYPRSSASSPNSSSTGWAGKK